MAEVNLRSLSPIFTSPCIITISDLSSQVINSSQHVCVPSQACTPGSECVNPNLGTGTDQLRYLTLNDNSLGPVS